MNVNLMHLNALRRLLSVLLLCGITLLGSLPVQAETQYWVYTVRPGDNIWDLTSKHCISVRYWLHIQQLNNVRLDREIPPGTKLRFPLNILKYQPATASVAKVRGKAQLVRASDNTTVPVTAKTTLRSGDRIITEPDANVTLRFADGSELLVLEESEIIMDTLSAWGTTGMVDTRVRLQGGRVDTTVKPSQGPGSRYQIITPAAVAAVRGTRFRVAAEKDTPLSRSEVTEGLVAVGDNSSRQDIKAGFGLVSERGKPAQAPRKLLPAPDLTATDKLQRELPLRFTWSALKGAKGYRLQIAPDDSFDTLIVDKVIKQTRAEGPDLPDGLYALRVRGIDEVGLEGLNGVRRFEVDARPLAPRATNMTGGVRTFKDKPEFHWEPMKNVSQYRFELARDAGFKQVVARKTSTQSNIRLNEPLLTGTYYWRIASVAGDGDQGPFSAVHHFNFRPALGVSGGVEAPVVKYSTLSITWQSVDQADTYHVQVAEDPGFKQMIADSRTDTATMEIQRPASQRYYVRVRAENTHGEVGAYTEPLEFTVPPHNYWGLLILLMPLLLAL